MLIAISKLNWHSMLMQRTKIRLSKKTCSKCAFKKHVGLNGTSPSYFKSSALRHVTVTREPMIRGARCLMSGWFFVHKITFFTECFGHYWCRTRWLLSSNQGCQGRVYCNNRTPAPRFVWRKWRLFQRSTSKTSSFKENPMKIVGQRWKLLLSRI